MAEQHEQLGQNLLPDLTLELDQPTETGKTPVSTVNTDSALCVSAVYVCIYQRGGDLHSYAGTQLGNIFRLLELFAKIQKVRTELMTLKTYTE